MSDDATLLEEIAARMRQTPRERGWITAFQAGEVLTTSQAAEVASVSPQTIRAWCEAADQTDRPLGFLIADLWLVDLNGLLRLVEARRGRHDRLVAEDRARKYAPILPRPELSMRNVAAGK